MAFFREELRARREEIAAAPGARRFVLRGRIATMAADGRVIADGFVCVADDLISAVTSADAGLPPEFQQAPFIQTGGTIYPGLIDFTIIRLTTPSRYGAVLGVT